MTRARGKSKRKAFLKAFSECGSITLAAKAVSIDRCMHYRWMEEPDYALAFQAADALVLQALEDAAYERAVTGVEEVVLHQGVPVKIDDKILTRRVYSDSLCALLLKARAPKKYRERVEHSGTVAVIDESPREQLTSKLASIIERLAGADKASDQRTIGS